MKTTMKKIIFICVLTCITTIFYGCWDYSEMNDLEYVSGIAIDKDKFTKEYVLTLELLKASVDGKNINSNLMESRGRTIHVALRQAIKKTGKLLQLSHTKVLIVNKDIAEDGITPVVDFINRDVEARNDMWVLISKMNTASEIFSTNKKGNDIVSYDLASAIKNSNKIGGYKQVEIFKLIKNISNIGSSATAPLVTMCKCNKNKTFKVTGIGLFKGENLIGQLDEEETMILQLLSEKKPRFVIPISLGNNENISLEIMNIHKKTKAKVVDRKISVDINVNMDVALSELAESGIDYVQNPKRNTLIKRSEKCLEKEAYKLIEKLQKQYKSDVIRAGDIVKIHEPKEWSKVKNKWNYIFQNININVFFHINIKYSGLTNKNIEIGD